MTSVERVLCAIGQQESDRVPFVMLLTMHGAKELGLSIKEYFSNGQNVFEGQKRLQEKYETDAYYSFFYAPIEVEAFGADVIYSDDGPPNSGTPFLNRSMIPSLKAPDVHRTPCLQKVYEATRLLKEHKGDQIPIIGVVMSPFSLPVMQMGFDNYLDLINDEKELFWKLMEVNKTFCIHWANAQLHAGATAICYFDPVSSTTIIPKELYRTTGFKVAKETIAQIQGPTATHFASGKCLGIIDEIVQTGTAVIGVSSEEEISEIKQKANQRLTILGNLNAIEMRHWSEAEVEEHVKAVIKGAGAGGGLLFGENHGEVPFQVTEETLMMIKHAVQKWGSYPLSWTE